MSEFTQACNIIDSPALVRNIPPIPTASRGENIQVYSNPKSDQLVYCSGRSVVVRSLSDPFGPGSFVYRGHNSPVKVAKFSPNGNWIASADESGKLRVWASNTPDKRSKLEVQILAGPVKDLDWDGESKKIVVCGDGGASTHVKCIMWDTGNSAGEFVGNTKRVTSCTYRQERPFRILIGGEDMKNVFYAGPPFKFDSETPSHTNFVSKVAYSPSGDRILSASLDKKVVLYDGKTGVLSSTYADVHTGGIYGAAWSSDGARILTCSGDKSCKLLDSSTGAAVATNVLGQNVGSMQVGCLFVGTTPVSVSLSGDINVFDAANFDAKPKVIEGHQANITAMAVDKSAEGSASAGVITASSDGVICAFPPSGGCSRFAGGANGDLVGNVHVGSVVTLDLLADGSVVSTGYDDVVRTSRRNAQGKYEAATASPLGAPPRASGSAGATVVVSSRSCLFTVREGSVVATLEVRYEPLCVAVSSDETTVVVGGADNKIYVYDVAAGGALTQNRVVAGTHLYPVSALSFSPSGSMLASGDSKEVVVWNTADWTTVVEGKWQFHAARITTLDWSPCGGYVVSSGTDENMFIWSLEKKSKRVQFKFVHKGGVVKLSWCGDYKIVTSGADGCVCEWMVEKDMKEKFK